MTQRTPTKLKLMTGNPSKRKINRKEPMPKGDIKADAPPSYLSAHAKRVWREIVGSMPAGMYTKADKQLLIGYCETAAVLKDILKELQGAPLMVEGSTGQMRANPLLKVKDEQTRILATAGARLGLDPISRQSIEVETGEGKGEDPFATLIG